MITVKCEQGTDEWRGIKAGVASPSNFDRLITASMKPSSQADDYLYELLGEWVVGMCKELPPNLYWVNRGTVMEPIARQHFEIIHGEVEKVGFAYKDKRKLVGCSPDGFLGKKQGVEIKCPSPIIHNAYYLRDECPKKYMPQVQGSMWVTGMSQWWFMSYHPHYPPLLVLVDSDPAWQRAIDQIVVPFAKNLEEMRLDKRVMELRQQRIEMEAAA
jgi:exodeoxyribonuclease (lambda-induced)